MTKATIIDYGMGNLGSLKRSLEVCGASVTIADTPAAVENVTHLLLPGVGSFWDGMNHLRERGWPSAIAACVKRGVPFLGICLGMQLLAESGDEGGPTEGLGLLPGKVEKLVPHPTAERIPHVGWNEVQYQPGHPLFADIAMNSDCYFVHSYHVVPSDSCDIAARTPYCGSFVSAVSRRNVYGVQFHPEKSQSIGLRLLRNFLNHRLTPC